MDNEHDERSFQNNLSYNLKKEKENTKITMKEHIGETKRLMASFLFLVVLTRFIVNESAMFVGHRR